MFENAAVLVHVSMSTSAYQVVALRLLEGIFIGTSTISMTIIASSVKEERLAHAKAVR